MTKPIPLDDPRLPEHIRDAMGQRMLHGLMHLMGEPWVTIASLPLEDGDDIGAMPEKYGPFWLYLHSEPGAAKDAIEAYGPYETFGDAEGAGLRWALSVQATRGKAVRA